MNIDASIAILNAMPDGLLLVDSKGIIRFANPAVEVLTGHSAEALIGLAVEVLVPAATVRSHVGLRQRYTRTPTSRAMGGALDLTLRRADDTEVPVEIALAPVVIEGHPHVAVSIRDVTDRRQADRERRRLLEQVAVSEQNFRSAFEGAPVGMVVTEIGPRGIRIARRVNEQFAAILDVDIEQVIGSDLRLRVHPDELVLDVDAGTAMLDGRQVAVRRDRRYQKTDGSFVWTNEQTVRMPDDGDRVFALSHIVDISVQRSKQETDAKARRLDGEIGILVTQLLEEGITAHTYNQIVMVAARLTGATDAGLVIQDEGPDVERLVGWHGSIAAEFADADTAPLAALTATVRASGAPVLIEPARVVPPSFAGRLSQILGVPLSLGDWTTAVLVVGVAAGAAPFDTDSQSMLESFATRIALALAAAQGRAAESRARLLDDRERIARDLHDTVIQDLFAAGMRISAALPLVADATVSQRLNDVVDQIDATIKKVRAVVFDLHTQQPGRSSLSQLVGECVSEASRALGFLPGLQTFGDLDSLPARLHDHLLGVLREGLSNVARHARATETSVVIRVADGRLSVRIDDNGVGASPDSAIGTGTRNVTARAAMFGGHAELKPADSGSGVSLRWVVPVNV